MILDFNYLLKNSRHLYIYLLSRVREMGQVTERTFFPFYNWKNHWDQIPVSGVLGNPQQTLSFAGESLGDWHA